MLADMAIPFLSGFALLAPIWAAVIRVPAAPRRIVWAGHVTRLTLPFCAACRIAEVVRAYFAWPSTQHSSACVTWYGHRRNVLYVFFTSWPVLFAECTLARPRAIDVSQFADSLGASDNNLAALGARYRLSCDFRGIAARSTAILLFRIVARRLKCLAAMRARLREIGSTRLICTGNRAEVLYPIRSFLEGVTAEFTCFHISIITQDHCISERLVLSE